MTQGTTSWAWRWEVTQPLSLSWPWFLFILFILYLMSNKLLNHDQFFCMWFGSAIFSFHFFFFFWLMDLLLWSLAISLCIWSCWCISLWYDVGFPLNWRAIFHLYSLICIWSRAKRSSVKITAFFNAIFRLSFNWVKC